MPVEALAECQPTLCCIMQPARQLKSFLREVASQNDSHLKPQTLQQDNGIARLAREPRKRVALRSMHLRHRKRAKAADSVARGLHPQRDMAPGPLQPIIQRVGLALEVEEAKIGSQENRRGEEVAGDSSIREVPR